MKLKIGSHFSGIGSINEAIQKYNLPFEVSYSIEWDKDAQQAYKEIYPTKEVFGDISKVNPSSLPPVDIIMTSPPCQAFSNAGLKKALSDDRGRILLETFRLIEYQKPKVVLFENVKNLKSIDNGKVFQFINTMFEMLGYKTYSKVLNSLNYGVPQNRERLFIVAVDKKITKPLTDTVEVPKPFYFPRKQKLTQTMKHLLCDNPVQSKELTKEVEKLFPVRTGKLTQSHQLQNHPHEMSARVYRPKISPTLVCASDNYFNIDNGFRTLTPRERFKLQGFTDKTIDKFLSMNPSRTVLQRFTGNTITVNVLGALLKQIEKLNIEEYDVSPTPTVESIYRWGKNYIETHFEKTQTKRDLGQFVSKLPLQTKQKLSAKTTHLMIREKNLKIINETIKTLKEQGIETTQYKIIKYSGLSKNTVKKYLNE
jgi:DNA (cytosine-5)-methyltransferase 1